MNPKQMSLEDVLKMAINLGIQTADEKIQKYTIENIKNREDRRLHNTKLLLENYRILIEKCKYIPKTKHITPFETLLEIEALMDPKVEHVLDSIQRSTERTNAMIGYINETLRMYKTFVKESKLPEEWRNYSIMCISYISKTRLTKEEMASKFHVDVRSIQRYKNDAIKTYSRFLWGVDSFKMVNFLSQNCR